jgi:hypothetical protein
VLDYLYPTGAYATAAAGEVVEDDVPDGAVWMGVRVAGQCGAGRVSRPDKWDPILRALRRGGDGTCVHPQQDGPYPGPPRKNLDHMTDPITPTISRMTRA